jgi:EEF1A lysine methyltransferase 2
MACTPLIFKTKGKMMGGIKEHWNNIFKLTQYEKLGWFESDFKQTLKFISKIDDLENKTIFIAGAGTTMLVDHLVGKCKKLILNDISNESLSIVRDRIGKVNQVIDWINVDISNPLPIEDEQIDIWIDRAVLHFLTEEHQIDGYFKNIKKLLKIGAYAIIAEFSKDGAPKCAGLEVHRYSVEELSKRCGTTFTLLEHEGYTFTNPNGDKRPYIYCLFIKIQ